jgi:pyridoxine 4-dehydrogenase
MSTFPLSGRPVRRVGFGAMQLPGPGVFGPPRDRHATLAVLRRAVELGVNHIDTAQYYGPDVSNELIREALHPYPDDLVLVSKVGAVRDAEGGWVPAQRPEQLRAAVEENLKTLAVDQLGAVNLRLMPADGLPEGMDPVPLEDQLAEMVALRDEGRIAGVGISNATLDQVETALEAAQITCVQNPFSLVDQHDTPVLDRCREAGVAYVPFFPLGSAFPGMPKVGDDPVVRRVAEQVVPGLDSHTCATVVRNVAPGTTVRIVS